jgi:hypothetical protein
MGLPADMRGQKEWAVPPRRFRMPGKKVARTEQADEARPKQEQPEMDRYLLQVDRQTKRSFKTAEASTVCRTGNQNPFPGSSGLHL